MTKAKVETAAPEQMDPFLRLREHAAKRPKMTKAELLADAEMCDEAYINASAERDMSEAYYKALDAHLKEHGCEHEYGVDFE